jgi:hypothetical protein
MKDKHKQPNDNSTELMEFKSDQLEKILLDFANSTCSNPGADLQDVQKFMDIHSLKYKKVKNTFEYYVASESIRLIIARQASKILRKEFGLNSPYTCYTYWSFRYGKYEIYIKYVAGDNRYLIRHFNADGKFKFETNSFKELFNKIKTLTK